MKKDVLCLPLLLFVFFNTSYLSAQVKFEKGIIETLDGKRENCIIKNSDWAQNPSRIEYKTQKGEVSKYASVDEIASFQIGSQSRYIRSTVEIDVSKEIIANLSRRREAEMETKTVFLKVIMEGDVNLYVFKDKDVTRYYYKLETSPIVPLIFKEYIDRDDKLRQNKAYVSELFENANCNRSKEEVRLLKYEYEDLLNYFKAYADCKGLEYTYFDDKVGRRSYGLELRGGINYNQFSVISGNERWDDVNYGRKLGGRFGIQFEYILPFQGGKWSLIADPNFQFFDLQEYVEGNHWGGSVDAEIKYRTVELPLGVSYRNFLADNISLFAKLLVVGNFSNAATVQHDFFGGLVTVDHEVSEAITLAFGLGAKLKKFSFEFRVLPAKDILKFAPSYYGRHSYGSVILGYQLF